MTTQEASTRRTGSSNVTNDPVLHVMIKDGIPITRENYIQLAYMGSPPKEWTAELESELPPEVQERGEF